MIAGKEVERVFVSLMNACGWITAHGLTVHHLPSGRWLFRSWIGECILPAHLPIARERILACVTAQADASLYYIEYLVTLIQCVCEHVHTELTRAGTPLVEA